MGGGVEASELFSSVYVNASTEFQPRSKQG